MMAGTYQEMGRNNVQRGARDRVGRAELLPTLALHGACHASLGHHGERMRHQ